ncbi:hypothetical protein TNCV_4358161 [Trichonephila clavipes]|nr:hypothetical protein TNCV_4358161 [Trichonephila clavipes]
MALAGNENSKHHLSIPANEKFNVCDICNKSFAQGWDLKRHLRIHTGEKPHVCEKCNASFTESSNLKKHLLVHTQMFWSSAQSDANPSVQFPRKRGTHLLTHLRDEKLSRPCTAWDLNPRPVVRNHDTLPLGFQSYHALHKELAYSATWWINL